jgi:hypothetical protein
MNAITEPPTKMPTPKAASLQKKITDDEISQGSG